MDDKYFCTTIQIVYHSMTKEIIKYSIASALILFYLIYTIRYSIRFNRNSVFNGRVRVFHFIMIWLIPFVWIFLLTSLMKSTPGSFEVKEKRNPESFTESGLGALADTPDNL